MGCHFCADEMFMILGVIAGVRYIPGWVKGKWAARHEKPTCRHDHRPGGAWHPHPKEVATITCDCGCDKFDGNHCLRKCKCVGCAIVRSGGG